MLVCLIGLCTLLVDRKWDDDKAFEMLSLALLCILGYVYYVYGFAKRIDKR